ncbi:hypothetical protein H04402_03370 [Clostridium botulinum H04402 065]|nr:hypothetical protein H04402_03370 [Clostridium botulinum H04402 065]
MLKKYLQECKKSIIKSSLSIRISVYTVGENEIFIKTLNKVI